jgi:hypothetical protein
LNVSGLSAGAINLSHLTSDPARLVEELQNATTGVPALDQEGLFEPQGPGRAFDLVVWLLVSPTTGASVHLDSELLDAMALCPRVRALGTMNAHDGRSGLGFTSSVPDSPTVIVDSHTGSLLEARSVQLPNATAIAGDYLSGTGTPSTFGFVGNWIDPTGTGFVVKTSDLPAAVRNIVKCLAPTNGGPPTQQGPRSCN